MEQLLYNFAKKITHILDKNNECTEVEQLQIIFGLQTLIYNFVVTTLILLLSSIIGTLLETLLLFIFFGSYRMTAGGFHFNNMTKCTLSTTLIMICGGKCIIFLRLNLLMCIVLCVLFNIIFMVHIPKGTKNNPYSLGYSQLQHKRLIILSFFLSLIALLSDTILRPTIILSMTITTILLLPTFYHRFRGTV